MKHKNSLLDSVIMLAVIGIVAGALGGLAIGVVTGRTTSSAAAAK
jgi:NhaP-type Na+/H+ or K+/H+ antiporter